MSKFQSKSESWVDARRTILAQVKAKTPQLLDTDQWDMSNVPANWKRVAYKMRAQFKALVLRNEELPADQRLTAQKMEEAVIRSRFRASCDYSVVGMLNEKAGGWLIAWVKYMSIRGRSMSQIVALARDAAACYVVALKSNRPNNQPPAIDSTVEKHILSREDQKDILALLNPAPGPFDAERARAIDETEFAPIAKKLCSLSEKDVDDMRQIYLPVQRQNGARDPKAVKRPREGLGGISRFLHFYFTQNGEDLLGIKEAVIELSNAELEELEQSPSLEAMSPKLRAKCLLLMPISYKNRTLQYAEVERANPAFRQKLEFYANRVKTIDPTKLTFVDETSLVKDAHLSKGWGPVGGPSLAIVPKSAGMRTAIWSACTVHELYTLILPPTTQVIGKQYRSLAKNAKKMKSICLLRADETYGLGINTYLQRVASIELVEPLPNNSLFSLPADQLNLMELAHFVAEKIRKGAKADKQFTLAGDLFEKMNKPDDLHFTRFDHLAAALVNKLDAAVKENSDFEKLTKTEIMNLAHADFLLREKCAKHNRYQKRPGTSKIFGSGRLGLHNGDFDEKKFMDQVTNYSFDPVYDDERDKGEEEEEEEILLKDETAAEPYVALFHIAKRLWFASEERPDRFTNAIVDMYGNANEYYGNRRGDIFEKIGQNYKLIGTSKPDYATPFSMTMPKDKLTELMDALFNELGVHFTPEVKSNMNMKNIQHAERHLKALTLYMLATSQNAQVDVLTFAESEVLIESELKSRFPIFQNQDWKNRMLSRTVEKAGHVRRFILPPFEIKNPDRKKRANIIDAESASVSSNQHLFREFLRSLPPSMVEGHTVVLDNASYHGGLRRAEIVALNKLCVDNQVCYEGKDLRAELSEEAWELRHRGGGRGLPTLGAVAGMNTKRNDIERLQDRLKAYHERTQPSLLFLPPYCPQLNPIETIFAVLKQQARRILDQAPQRTRKALTCSILRAAQKIGKEILTAEFRLSGYLNAKNQPVSLDTKSFLANAGILGYVLRRINKQSATKPAPPVNRIRTVETPAIDEQIAHVKTTVQTVMDSDISQAAKNILMRAYNIRPSGGGLKVQNPFAAAPRNQVKRAGTGKKRTIEEEYETDEEEEEEEPVIRIHRNQGENKRPLRPKKGIKHTLFGTTEQAIVDNINRLLDSKQNTSQFPFDFDQLTEFINSEEYNTWYSDLDENFKSKMDAIKKRVRQRLTGKK